MPYGAGGSDFCRVKSAIRSEFGLRLDENAEIETHLCADRRLYVVAG